MLGWPPSEPYMQDFLAYGSPRRKNQKSGSRAALSRRAQGTRDPIGRYVVLDPIGEGPFPQSAMHLSLWPLFRKGKEVCGNGLFPRTISEHAPRALRAPLDLTISGFYLSLRPRARVSSARGLPTTGDTTHTSQSSPANFLSLDPFAIIATTEHPMPLSEGP